MKPEAHLNLILENVKLFQIHGHEKKCWKCKARKKIEPFCHRMSAKLHTHKKLLKGVYCKILDRNFFLFS